MSFESSRGSQSTRSYSDKGAPDLVALYLRVADTLERSAELAEDHAQRYREKGEQQTADLELERAKRARLAAQRGRALALRLQASDAHRQHSLRGLRAALS